MKWYDFIGVDRKDELKIFWITISLAIITHILYQVTFFRFEQIYLFFIYLCSICLPFIFLIYRRVINRGINFFYPIPHKYSLFVFLLLLLAIITRFIFIQSYPFVSTWDPVRDGGLLAQEVAEGIKHNIFGNGPYYGWGRVMLGFSSISYKIFGPSVLTYRIPAAIISVLSIIFIYIAILKITKKNTVALLGMLVMICSPQHLFFSRSEVLLLITLLLSIVIIIQLYRLYINHSIKNYILLAIILGFSFNFHVSIWAIILFSTIVSFIILIKENIYSKKRVINTSIIFLIFFLIGVGPRIYYLNYKVIFQDFNSWGKISFVEQFKKNVVNKNEITIKEVNKEKNKEKNNGEGNNDLTFFQKYQKSFLVYFYENATSHTSDPQPLLPFVIGICFLIGLFYTYFIYDNSYLKIIGILTLILPLTNSTITNGINFDNRTLVLVPFAAIFSALGMDYIFLKIKELKELKKYQYSSKVKIAYLILFSLPLLYLPYDFFMNAKGNKNLKLYDFAVMHSIYLIKNYYPEAYVPLPLDTSGDEKKDVNDIIELLLTGNAELESNKNKDKNKGKNNKAAQLCISASGDFLKFLKQKHIEEQFTYFLYPISVQVKFNDNLGSDSLYISKKCWEGWNISRPVAKYYLCNKYDKWVCPADEEYRNKNFYILIDESLNGPTIPKN
ncbi:MAG: glycosyltransferase family 39 protein [Oligoflexia bacterium]|nr:glycosyltransferase family 39 protein [Oligoflexia bacterium]